MKWRASMFAPARKGRISCAVKSNAKNLRGLGKERRLIFLWLVLFSRRGTGYEILTSSVYVFTTESHLPLAGHAPHVSCSFLKLFQSTEPNLISGRRQKRGWANGCHSIFCKKPVSLCLSAQERLITTRINIRVRIWVLQWEERKKRKPPRTPVKSFIIFLVLTVSRHRVFSHDITAAILVSQNNETAAMLVSQTNPVGVELLSYANAFFCSNKFA